MFHTIDPNNKNFRRINNMAIKSHIVIAYAHESGIPGKKQDDEESPFYGFSASQFVVHLLKNTNKPMSENLILKRMNENAIFMPYARIDQLMIELYGEGVIERFGKKGYVLTLE